MRLLSGMCFVLSFFCLPAAAVSANEKFSNSTSARKRIAAEC